MAATPVPTSYKLSSNNGTDVSLADDTVIPAIGGLTVQFISASALAAINAGILTVTPALITAPTGVAADDIGTLFNLVNSLTARLAAVEQASKISNYAYSA